MPRLLITFLLAAVAGCGGKSTAENEEVRSDSAGVRIVTHHGPDIPLHWRFTPAWSVGGSSDDRLPLTELGVHHLAVVPPGLVAVLDEAGHRVLVLTSEGEVLRAFGQQGGGPGELLSPSALAAEADGTIAVYDFGKQALVRWSVAGEPLPEVRMAVPFWGPGIRAHATNSYLFTALSATDAGTSEQWLVEWGSAGERRLVPFRRAADRTADFSICGFAGIPIAPLFAPELNWDAAANRIAVNTGVDYRVDVLEQGSVVLSIRRDVPLRAVTEAMAYHEAGDGLPIPVANCVVPPAVLVRERGYEAVLPGVADLTLSPAGELWVSRRVVGKEPRIVDVFSPDGTYLGTLAPDSPFPVAFLPDGRIIALEPDVFDAPRIVAYAVTRY